jgi:hypothetical protein
MSKENDKDVCPHCGGDPMKVDRFQFDEAKVEQRGYQRGYTAGKKRKQREFHEDQREKERRAFRHRAFLAALPAIVALDPSITRNVEGDNKPMNSTANRVAYAWSIANSAVKGFY